MLKLCKWIYRLGVLHERRRIKLLIAQHREMKPERPSEKAKDNEWNVNNYQQDLNLWYGVQSEMDKLTRSPLSTTIHEVDPAPIDEA